MTASARYHATRLHRTTASNRMRVGMRYPPSGAPPVLTSLAVTCTPRNFLARGATAQRPISQGHACTNNKRAHITRARRMITHDMAPCYVLTDPLMAAAYTRCIELPMLSNDCLLEYIYNEIFKGGWPSTTLPRTSRRPTRSKYDRPTWGEQPPTTSGHCPGVGLPICTVIVGTL